MLIFKGFLIGLAIAAPVGPIALLCINKSLKEGFGAGFISGLGAAFADATYGLIVAFGLSIVSNFLLKFQNIIQITGGIFLCYIGIKIIWGHKRHAEKILHVRKSTYLKSFITTYFLTITNPLTILSFIAIFASLGNIGTAGYISSLYVVFGLFLGSATYFLILTLITACILRKRINEKIDKMITNISGLLIISFGIYALRILVM
jgi:threonine/homoserine/homoserine lactone efflux protein